MAVIVNVVTRMDQAGIKAAQAQLTRFSKQAAADSTSAAGAFIRSGQKMTAFGNSMTSIGKNLTKFVTVPIVAMAALSVRAAMKQQQAFAVLDLQTRRNTAATKEQTKAVDAFVIAQAELTGNAVSSVIPVMGRLEIATKSRTKAEMLLKVAEDVSAGTGKNLTMVGIALSRAYQGTTTSLGRLGIQTSVMEPIQKKVTAAMALASHGTLKAGQSTEVLKKTTLTFAQLLPRIIKAYGGDAAKAANTTAGRFDRFKVAVHQVAVEFGSDLLPMVDKGLGYLDRLTHWMSGLSPATRKWVEELAGTAAVLGPLMMGTGFFVTKLGQMSTGIGVAGSAIKGLGGGLAGLTKMFGMSGLATMGWIGLIILVIAALVLAYMKVKWFRDGVNDCVRFIVRIFKDFGKVVGDVFDFIKAHLRVFIDFLLIAGGPVVWLAGLVIKNFGAIKTIVGDVLSWLWTEWKWVWNNILKWTPLGAVVAIFETLVSEIASHWDSIVSIIGGCVNEIGRILNDAFGWIPGWKNIGSVSWGSSGTNNGGTSGNKTTPKGSHTAHGGGSLVGDIGSSISHAAGSLVNDAGAAAGWAYDVAGLHLPGVTGAGPLGGVMKGVEGIVKSLIGKMIGGAIGTGKGNPGAIIRFAESFLGVPYLWGGTSPAGFDCSGFVQFVYDHFGVRLPRVAAAQQQVGRPVNPPYIPGDLAFFGRPAHHVGMVVSGDTMIDAPHTGSFVRFDPGFEGWSDFSGVRRVLAMLGGTFTGPQSGYPAILHGTETIVSHDHPQRGLAGLAAAGVGGDTYVINFPPGLVIGSAEAVVAQLHPLIERAQRIAAARRNRGRVGS